METDWAALRAAAIEVMHRAYAPYSKFPVGAAALVDDGRVIVGCNVENAAYGVALCAECGVVSQLHASGGGRVVALSCVDASGEPLMPCGRCRQLLWENGGPRCLIDARPAPRSMAELLPYGFDVNDLDAIGPARAHGPVVPARLAHWKGRGTVFVHPDQVGGDRVWTGYWERSYGFDAVARPPAAAEPVSVRPAHMWPAGEAVPASARSGDDAPAVGILEEAPTWPAVEDAIAWGRVRTTRVVVIDADGVAHWAGEGEPPTAITERWPS